MMEEHEIVFKLLNYKTVWSFKSYLELTTSGAPRLLAYIKETEKSELKIYSCLYKNGEWVLEGEIPEANLH